MNQDNIYSNKQDNRYEPYYPLPEDFIDKPSSNKKIFGDVIENNINYYQYLKEKFNNKEFVMHIILSDKNGHEFIKTEISYLLM